MAQATNAAIAVQMAGLNAFAATAAIPIVGPVAAPAAMAAAIGITAPMAASVSALAISGMAHSGIDEIPKEGTWLLDKGERVYTNSSAKQIDQMHGMLANGRNSGGQVNWTINVESHQGEAQVDTYIDDEKKVVSIVLRDINSSGQIYNSLSQKLGVKGGGWK